MRAADSVRALLVLLELNIHLMHKHSVLLLNHAVSYLASVVQRKASTGLLSDGLDASVLARVNFFKNVRVLPFALRFLVLHAVHWNFHEAHSMHMLCNVHCFGGLRYGWLLVTSNSSQYRKAIYSTNVFQSSVYARCCQEIGRILTPAVRCTCSSQVINMRINKVAPKVEELDASLKMCKDGDEFMYLRSSCAFFTTSTHKFSKFETRLCPLLKPLCARTGLLLTPACYMFWCALCEVD
jgi:hypothetical protein